MDLSFIYSVKAAVDKIEKNELMTEEEWYEGLKSGVVAKKDYYLQDVVVPKINKFVLKQETVKPIAEKEEKKVKVLKESEKSKRIAETTIKKEEKERPIFKSSEREERKEISVRTGAKLLPKPDSIISLFKSTAKPYVMPSEAHLVQLPTADVALKAMVKSKEGLRPTLSVAVSKAENNKKIIIDSIDISLLNSGKANSGKSYKDTKIKELLKQLGVKQKSGNKHEKILLVLDDIIKYGSDKQRSLAEKRKAEEMEKSK